MGCTGYSWREMLGHADEILVDNRSLIYMINTGGPELAPRRKPEWEYSISGSKNIPKFGFLKLQSFYDIKSEAKNMCDAEPGHPDPYDTSQQRPEARGGLHQSSSCTTTSTFQNKVTFFGWWSERRIHDESWYSKGNCKLNLCLHDNHRSRGDHAAIRKFQISTYYSSAYDSKVNIIDAILEVSCQEILLGPMSEIKFRGPAKAMPSTYHTKTTNYRTQRAEDALTLLYLSLYLSR